MIGLSILIGAYWIADAILFIHGYKSFWWCANTDQEKAVRKAMFEVKGIEWDDKQ
jgi:hypothetical protein